MSAAPCLDELVDRATERFRQTFGRSPRYVVAAPGRVNLIGEHTDYNGGFVLPMAIERYTVIAADPGEGTKGNLVRCVSGASNEPAEFIADSSLQPGEPRWANYVRGVVAEVIQSGINVPSFDAAIESSVPLGGGLSSSASLEVATATLLENLAQLPLDPLAKARLCQKAEHEFANVPCGIMDQFTSTFACRDHALLIDCQHEKSESVLFDDDEVAVLIINSNVHHTLVGSPYAERRAQCHSAAEALGAKQLREATSHRLEAFRERLDPLVHKRARHVVTENERTLLAAKGLADRRWSQVGSLMYESHTSLKDDFEVSCAELDLLVDLAQQLGSKGGIYGSRMTGGGFGGCTVTLVQSGQAIAFAEAITAAYRQATGIEPSWFITRPADGARCLTDSAALGSHPSSLPPTQLASKATT